MWINLGRHAFPAVLLMMAEDRSMLQVIRKRPQMITWLTLLLPALTMALYIPPVYEALVDFNGAWRGVAFYLSYGWIVAYLALAVFLLVWELFSITMHFFRRQFLMLVVCLVSLAVLYFVYCGQDPGQVYSFYSYDYVGHKGRRLYAADAGPRGVCAARGAERDRRLPRHRHAAALYGGTPSRPTARTRASSASSTSRARARASLSTA